MAYLKVKHVVTVCLKATPADYTVEDQSMIKYLLLQ